MCWDSSLQLCRPIFEREVCESAGIDRWREGRVFEIERCSFAGQDSNVWFVSVLKLIGSVQVQCIEIEWCITQFLYYRTVSNTFAPCEDIGHLGCKDGPL